MAFTNKIFAYLRGNNDQFTDVKIVSSQQVWFKAHKFVLAAASPVFHELFLSDPKCKISNSRPLRQWLLEQLFQQSFWEQMFQQ